MLIHEISKKTGVSKKAIYIYEQKGLLKVERQQNRYRSYSEADEKRLNQIKLLRLAGVPIADIKLLFDRVITLAELTEKRKTEIEREYGSHSEQLALCRERLQAYQNQDYSEISFQEEETIRTVVQEGDLLAAGLDIGTTTISAAVWDLTQRCQVEFFTLQNKKSSQPGSGRAEQDADEIYEKAKKLLDCILEDYPGIQTVGVTGQMHGMLYIDNLGRAVSPFVTWQDQRGEEPYCEGKTYCEKFREQTGEKIATGYGLLTHFYAMRHQIVPPTAVSFCNIADYIVMRLTGRTSPFLHSSIAASFGLFDCKEMSFQQELFQRLGESAVHLPEVINTPEICGAYRGVQVSAAIGDNQASFLGSVDNLEECILLNIGTGSQISMIDDGSQCYENGMEVRPLFGSLRLLCGSALCGGEAYSLMEKLFRGFVHLTHGGDRPVYDCMNQLAWQAYREHKNPIQAEVLFRGSREHPEQTASFTGITEENFSAGQLILSVVTGVCQELYNFFGSSVLGKKTVVASGNAIQKNDIFLRVIEDIFQMPVKVPRYQEEAATGAALFSAAAGGLITMEDRT